MTEERAIDVYVPETLARRCMHIMSSVAYETLILAAQQDYLFLFFLFLTLQDLREFL
jgi:hypothetical protein